MITREDLLRLAGGSPSKGSGAKKAPRKAPRKVKGTRRGKK